MGSEVNATKDGRFLQHRNNGVHLGIYWTLRGFLVYLCENIVPENKRYDTLKH